MPTLTLTHYEYAKYIEFLALRQPQHDDAPNQGSFYKGSFYIDPNGTCVTQERPTKENTYDMNTSLLIPTNFHKWKLDSKEAALLQIAERLESISSIMNCWGSERLR